MKKAFSIIGVAIILAAIVVYGTYVGIISNDESVAQSWGDVESTYQRRMDLIPNLVKVVERYAAHERGTFEAVTTARASVGQFKISQEMLSNPETLAKFQAAQGELGSALMRLMAVSENYPTLKADQNFLKLQDQLEGTENRINVARRDYNKTVRTFNISIRGPIGHVVNTSFLDLKPKEPFKSQEGADVAPQVQFQR